MTEEQLTDRHSPLLDEIALALVYNAPEPTLVFWHTACVALNERAAKHLNVSGVANAGVAARRLFGTCIDDILATDHSTEKHIESHCVTISSVVVGDIRVLTIRDKRTQYRLRQAELLASLGMLVSEAPGTRGLPSYILQLISAHVPVDVGVMALFDRDVLRPVAWQGMMLDPIAVPLQQNRAVLRAVETCEVVVGDGAEWGSRLDIARYRIIPLRGENAVIGTLHLGFAWGEGLWADDAFLLELGTYVANAVESVQKFDQLADEQNRLRLIVDRLPEGVLVFNGRGEVLVANPALVDILEMVPENLNTDRRPYRLRDASMRVLSRSDWPSFRAARLGKGVHDERLILDFDRRLKHVDVSVVLLPSADGRTIHFMGALQDVTERTESDFRKDEFLSVASHEMRSPLTPLKGFIQMAIQQVERGDAVDARVLRRAEEQVSRLARLIDDMLDLTRIDSGQLLVAPSHTDIVKLFANLVDTRWPGRVFLRGPVKAVVWVDGRRLEQVVSNLVENALKHSGSDTVDVMVEVEASRAKIIVSDHGRGIEPEHLPHIFERFYRSDLHFPGTGLGLYITRQIVEQHGGEIRVESTVGVGTTFYVDLPTEAH